MKMVESEISNPSITKNEINTIINRLFEFPYDLELRTKLDLILLEIKDYQLQTYIKKYFDFEKLLPSTFTLETVLSCNLKCPECAIGGAAINRKKGILSYENFVGIADKIKPFVKYFYLHLWGEPLLNKDIFKMIKYASEFTKTNISTNGNTVTPEIAEKLIESGVSDIIVSIDGISQEVYSKYRVGGNVSKALDSLKYLTEARQINNSKTNIIPQFIVFEHNQHEMGIFSEYVNSLGLNATFKSPYIRTNDSNFRNSDNPKYIRPTYNSVEELKIAMRDCVNPRDVFTINLDGSVVLCCHDFDGKTNYGNIFEQDVLEIWNSPKFKEDRWRIISGNPPELCLNDCLTYYLKTEKTPTPKQKEIKKVNLCGGPINIKGFINVDISPNADIVLDLENELLPFENNSIDTLVCISAINYFEFNRGFEVIKDVYRVMKDNGIVRFAVQDLRKLTKKYLDKDSKFFDEKLLNGSDRFPGISYADKFNQWFYGFKSGGKTCKYVYDYETLEILFKKAGFNLVVEKQYFESAIPEIEQIDNRPEQMFFLEAIKINENKQDLKIKIEKSLFIESLRIQYPKQPEQVWQKLIQYYEQNEYDYATVLFVSEILMEKKKYSDGIDLLSKFKYKYELDDILQKRLKEFTIKLKIKTDNINAKTVNNRNIIPKLNEYKNNILTDIEHLDASIQWIETAFNVYNQKGVAATYEIQSGEWTNAYPETTGYIIPTFIEYYHLTQNPHYLQLAKKMGDWEISIQWQNGGVGEPVGVLGLKPRVFNTAQVILGWLALYEETKDQKYLNAAQKAGDWLIKIQDSDGKWSSFTYQGPKSYHVRVAWTLLLLTQLSNQVKYEQAVRKFLKWLKPITKENGWFYQTSLSEPNKPWTHLTGYTLVGLLKIMQLKKENADDWFINVLGNAVKNLISFYKNSFQGGNLHHYAGFPGTFDENWQSSNNWACVTGSAQLEYFIRNFEMSYGAFTNIKIADQILNEIKEVQYIGNNFGEDFYGGLPGSFPILTGQYSKTSIVNWGVKFFADSLLQKILPNKEMKFLG